MNIPKILRGGIATARKITLSAHVPVTWKAWTGQSYDGTPTYKVRTGVKALVDDRPMKVKNLEGIEVMSHNYLGFIEQLPATTVTDSASPRRNPVDPRDVFVLADGTTGPIVAIDGFRDGGTGVPFYSQVRLG